MDIEIHIPRLLPTPDEFVAFFSAFCLVWILILLIGEIVFLLQADWHKEKAEMVSSFLLSINIYFCKRGKLKESDLVDKRP